MDGNPGTDSNVTDRRTVLRAVAALPVVAGLGAGSADAAGSEFEVDVVAEDLVVPWGAAFRGDTLYVTERPGYLTEITDQGHDRVADFTDETAEFHDDGAPDNATSGLCGLAFRPDDPDVAYLYQSYRTGDGGIENRVLTYDLESGERDVLFDGIGASYWQDGGRLLVEDDALYVTTGQGQYFGNPNPAVRDPSTLVGKTLRLTLDGEPHPDNPFGNAVYTLGHRNPEGIAVRRDGRLFATEHGPSRDDEINLLEPGNDYGWPEVTGESDDPAFTDPLVSYTPTIATAGATFYYGENPDWTGDFFFATLKWKTLYRLRFTEGARPERVEQEKLLAGKYGRLRTVLTGPDGHLYVTTSNRDQNQNQYTGSAGTPDMILRLRRSPSEGAEHHTLVFDGAGSRSTYEFSVSGEVTGGRDLGGVDSFSGSSGSGAVYGWKDTYTFTGALDSLSVDGTATTYLDGEAVDPADYGEVHTLEIVGDGPRSTYEFAVSGGEITADDGVDSGDSIAADGTSASGVVYGWSDAYTFTGALDSLSVDGTATAYLDGEAVDPADYGDEHHTLVFDGAGSRSTYEFSVSGEVTGGTDLGGVDSFSGSSGSGAVYGWKDTYTFTGRVERLVVNGDADVYVDGEPY